MTYDIWKSDILNRHIKEDILTTTSTNYTSTWQFYQEQIHCSNLNKSSTLHPMRKTLRYNSPVVINHPKFLLPSYTIMGLKYSYNKVQFYIIYHFGAQLKYMGSIWSHFNLLNFTIILIFFISFYSLLHIKILKCKMK